MICDLEELIDDLSELFPESKFALLRRLD